MMLVLCPEMPQAQHVFFSLQSKMWIPFTYIFLWAYFYFKLWEKLKQHAAKRALLIHYRRKIRLKANLLSRSALHLKNVSADELAKTLPAPVPSQKRSPRNTLQQPLGLQQSNSNTIEVPDTRQVLVVHPGGRRPIVIDGSNVVSIYRSRSKKPNPYINDAAARILSPVK